MHNPKILNLLKQMTLEEKLAQMTILDVPDHIELDHAHLQEFLSEWPHGVGALSRPGLKRTPKATAELTNVFQQYLTKHTRLGIPALVIDEALHGLMAHGATSFPQAIALASTWDPDLVRQVFKATAREMRSRGGNLALTPVLDLARDPRWGRTEETYGEDPYLVSQIGLAAVRGLQGDTLPVSDQHVIATAKHFAVHGQPEAGTNAAPANYAERDIREAFLIPFQIAVQEGKVQCVMASYNEVNGIPVHVNTWLLRDILRNEWGFEGFITSDGGGIEQLQTLHHVVSDIGEAARKALETGVDFELDHCFSSLAEQVRKGLISEALIDQAVLRILNAKQLLGLFDTYQFPPERAEELNNCTLHRQLALKAAHEAVILLNNDNNLLPLDLTKLKTMAVIGPNAADLHLGGYSVDPGRGISVLQGLQNKLGPERVMYAEGCRITEGVQGWQQWWLDTVTLADPLENQARIEHAVQVSKIADVVVLVLGENEGVCREGWSTQHLGDRDSLDLPAQQNELAEAIFATGKPTIVLLLNGRPLTINRIAEQASAILEGWYLGQETGTAVADIIFGEVNPGGRLPITIPRSVGQIPAYYYHKPSARRGYLFTDHAPLFCFGHGLSYTTFEYSNLELSSLRIMPDQSVKVYVDITNTGNRVGDEVVQVYLHDLVASVTRPVKKLCSFLRLTLQPGETRRITFEIGFKDLQVLGEELKPVVEPGFFDIMIGPSSERYQTVQLEVMPPEQV
jgi:beta-glucosidase